MKKIIKLLPIISRRKVLLSALFFMTILTACKKKGSIVPQFDQPPYNVYFTDTISLKVETQPEDSVLTSLSVYQLLGKLNDPVFGITHAGFYTQLSLTGTNVDFGTNVVLDSCVLSLDYQDIYGSETDVLNLKVFELSEDLYVDSNYYSNDAKQVLNEIASISKPFAINDSVMVDTILSKPQLRIPLSTAFGQKLLNAGGTSDLADNESFLQFMKGLFVTVDTAQILNSGEGAVAYFDLNSVISNVTLYYTNTDSAKQYSYTFDINSGCAKYSVFSHDYTGTEIEQAFNQPETFDTLYNYLQAAAGLQLKINFPFINTLKEQNLLVNKVELIFPVENSKINGFSPPDKITASKLNENGTLEFLPDVYESVSYFGGDYDEIKQEYTLNITRHFQELINGKENDYGVVVKVSGTSIQANRVVLGAPGNKNKKVKLRLYYTN